MAFHEMFLWIPGKNDRLIWDGTVRLSGNSTLVNAHTKLSNEPTMHYGDAFNKHLHSILCLCLTRPLEDILLLDNNVKRCFQHPKINLKLVTAFSFIFQEFLCIPIGKVCDSNTSPFNWEPFAPDRCFLAKSIFANKTLDKTHQVLLNKVRFS